MTDIPDEAVESAARALFVMQHRVDVGCFDKQSYKALADACIREARNALTAAAPIIRADERRRAIAEIQASDLGAPLQLNPDGTARFLTGPELRERICVFIAERSGK